MRLEKKALSVMLVFSSVLLWNCDPINPVGDTTVGDYSCEGCHTSETLLSGIIETLDLEAAAETAVPGYGTPGNLDLIDKVWIKLNAASGIVSFADIDSTHARISCAGCHGGVAFADASDDTSAYRIAHTGLLRDPSAIGETGCSGGSCHREIVTRNETSLHSNLWGQKAHIALRNGYDSFEDCPATVQDGFTADCASCHTTCGQCHISRPDVGGGGFQDQRVGYSHKFNRTPSEEHVCTVCHASRIGDDWNANQVRVPGNEPDVHNSYGYTCLDCHSEELHGEGAGDADYTSRYQVNGLPQCIDCHQIDFDDNAYHVNHWPNGNPDDGPDLACQVCHSQQYTNCNTCHALSWTSEYEPDNSGEYKVYAQFKIGLNRDYDQPNRPHNNAAWIAVRHVPVAPESFADWGVNIMSNYDVEETWKYTSPHNIQRWTDRTLVDPSWADNSDQVYDSNSCNDNCHMHGTRGSFPPPMQNLDLYLVSDDHVSDFTGEDLSDETAANYYTRLDSLTDNSQSLCWACHPPAN